MTHDDASILRLAAENSERIAELEGRLAGVRATIEAAWTEGRSGSWLITDLRAILDAPQEESG